MNGNCGAVYRIRTWFQPVSTVDLPYQLHAFPPIRQAAFVARDVRPCTKSYIARGSRNIMPFGHELAKRAILFQSTFSIRCTSSIAKVFANSTAPSSVVAGTPQAFC